jgi:exodeoxyribonuclease VII large subunit
VNRDLFAAAAAAGGFDEERNADAARRFAARSATERGSGEGPEGGWTPSTVNAAARDLIQGAFPPLWVGGEVGTFTRARSGHCYFTLRDSAAQLRCVMWRDDARRLPTAPAEGMEVRALGRLTLYEARGEFQLSVVEVEGKGEGLWKLAVERLRARLESEGLTAPSRKRPLPEHPACVGIVTSASGAALHDIVTVIRRRAPWTRIVLSAARVQGEGAAAEIVAAIERLVAARCADVIIVGRGGGSIEDLWAFNEEAVARAIAAAPIPVISAVGHETDITIADLVADLRAPTPSAAAEAAVPDGPVLARRLAETRIRIARCALERVEAGGGRVAEALERLGAAARGRVERRREILAAAAGRLHALSPLSTLARGFAVPLDGEGRLLRTTAAFAPGVSFRLRLLDGTVAATADSIHPSDPAA